MYHIYIIYIIVQVLNTFIFNCR